MSFAPTLSSHCLLLIKNKYKNDVTLVFFVDNFFVPEKDGMTMVIQYFWKNGIWSVNATCWRRRNELNPLKRVELYWKYKAIMLKYYIDLDF
jgi:hypothetical protein